MQRVRFLEDAVVLLGCAIAFNACVSVINPKPEGCSENSPARVDTEEGYHRLSDHFGYEFKGKPTRKWSVSYFHIPEGEEAPGRLIGQARWDMGGNSSLDLSRFFVDPSCSRQALYAISADGSTLLYFHELPVGPKKGPLRDKSEGLYRFVHGGGERHAIHEIVNRGGGLSNWSDLPMDQVAIRADAGSYNESTPVCGVPLRGLYGDGMIVEANGRATPAWLMDAPVLHRAVFDEDLAALKTILAASTSIDERYLGFTPLHVSAIYGRDPAVFRQLLSAGADPDASVELFDIDDSPSLHDETATPLSILLDVASGEASRSFVPAALDALFESGADLDKQSEHYDGREELWHSAMLAGRPIGVAEVLGRHGIKLSPERATTLLAVVALQLDDDDDHGDWVAAHLERPRILVEAGADINHRNEYGQTPLFRTHNKKMIDVLLELGADPKIQDNEGRRTSLEPKSRYH